MSNSEDSNDAWKKKEQKKKKMRREADMWGERRGRRERELGLSDWSRKEEIKGERIKWGATSLIGSKWILFIH